MIGKIICDLAPTRENNRNSEGAFITLKDGKILFAYSRYGCDGFEDGAAADIYGVISDDNGETFGKPFPIITHKALKADNIMSVSFLRMKNGDLGMFFALKKSGNCIYCLVRSSDEGASWSDPVVCSGESGYFVVNNDRVIRCSNGRLLIPAAFHRLNYTTDQNGNKIIKSISSGVLYVFASDDDGFSWNTVAKDISLPLSRGLTTGVQEPGIIQLENDKLWCYIRNDSGRQYETFSYDNGVSWSEPFPSGFTSPCSPISMKRLSDNRLLAVWNPIPVYNGRSETVNGVWTGARTPFVLALSSDNGESFTSPVAIETDEACGYCYTAIHETADGGILLAYCAGGINDKCTLNRLRIRKLSIKEL